MLRGIARRKDLDVVTVKRLTAANENLTAGRSRAEAQEYWAEVHGKLVANRPTLKRYHHYFSLPEAYESSPKPTFIGISMFWNVDPLAAEQMPPGAFWPIGPDDRQLFDREPKWPRQDQHADILGEEHVILDGQSGTGMLAAIFMVCRRPGLSHKDFFEHWKGDHAALAAKLPGLRRYTQNHAVMDTAGRGNLTHEGWSEFWFDDFAAFQRATQSPEWAAMQEDGATLFAPEMGIVIGREYVQKDDSWRPSDWGVLSLNEEQIRERLKREGYALAENPEAPSKIKTAAEKNMLGVWTPEHLVTLDDSRIDVRPG
jgi:uncharacterized protein (TIGR02118 family)